MKILIIAAHPDDEVLGCGGTIARLSRAGHNVSVVLLGEGVTSRWKNRKAGSSAQIKSLADQSRQAAEILGVSELTLYKYPDNRFDTVPLLDIVKTIESHIDNTKPQIVYTHHGADLNIDHSITVRAVLTATRPTAACPVKQLYAFEVPSSTEWVFHQMGTSFHPNVFMDVTETLETKIDAIKAYKMEIKQFPHPRSIELLQINAQKWGSTIGVHAAEAFELIRHIE